MKKILARVLMMAMVLSLLTVALPANSLAEEPMKLQMLMDEQTADYATLDAPVVKALEERFNVEFEFVFYSSTGSAFPEWINTRIIADQFPECWSNSSQGAKAYHDFVDQGLLAELPWEMIEENMPNIVKWAERFKEYSGGVSLWDYIKIDDKIYCLPYAWYEGAQRNVTGFRGDWLKNVGIDKVPETIEEYEEALKRFTFNDPDGDGKDNTYGYSHISDPIFGFNWLYPAFGTNPNNFSVRDGRVTRDEIEPGSKQGLEILNRWYEAGYIDPEWVTNGWEEAQNRVVSEKIGLTWQGYPCFCEWDGWFLHKLLEVNPDAYWELSGGPVGPNGDYGCVQFNPVNGGGMYFSADLTPEKMAKYMQILDAVCFDEEILLLLHRGVEGTHYEKTENGYEWLPPYDDLQTRQQAGFSHGDNFGIYNLTASGNFRDPEILDPIFYTNDQLEVKRACEALTHGPIDPLAPFSFEAWSEYGEALSRLTTQAYTDFITGARDLDTFDDYVKEWRELGGDEVLAEAQAKYDEVFGGK